MTYPPLSLRLAIQQDFLIQILLVFLRFELLPNFIFQCYRPQTWQLYLFFLALSISAIHEVLGIKFKGGRSHYPYCKRPIDKHTSERDPRSYEET